MLNWSKSENYHHRRLASEGSRQKLPWCQKINLDYKKTIKILDNLYFDESRYVTRSVANHLNDISKIDGVNSQIKEVAELNQRIFTIEIQGQSANSARDRRDVLVKQLSSSLGVQSYPDSKGMLAVQLPGGLPLVQGNMAMTIEGQQNGTDLDLVLHTGGVTRPIGLNNLGGEFEGLVNIRDQFIPSIKDDLDRLAYEITEAVNTTHAAGAGLDSVTGRNFFSSPNPLPPPPASDPWLDAARNISVVISDSTHVAAAAAPTPPATVAPGDNRNALLMSNIGENHLIDGIDNFGAYYGKITATVGLESNQNKLALGGAEDAMIQLQNIRDGLSGVSLEEQLNKIKKGVGYL